MRLVERKLPVSSRRSLFGLKICWYFAFGCRWSFVDPLVDDDFLLKVFDVLRVIQFFSCPCEETSKVSLFVRDPAELEVAADEHDDGLKCESEHLVVVAVHCARFSFVEMDLYPRDHVAVFADGFDVPVDDYPVGSDRPDELEVVVCVALPRCRFVVSRPFGVAGSMLRDLGCSEVFQASLELLEDRCSSCSGCLGKIIGLASGMGSSDNRGSPGLRTYWRRTFFSAMVTSFVAVLLLVR